MRAQHSEINQQDHRANRHAIADDRKGPDIAGAARVDQTADGATFKIGPAGKQLALSAVRTALAQTPGQRRNDQLSLLDVLGARPLGALAFFERHRLTFAELVESGAHTGGVVEEVLGAVRRRDEAETLVAHNALNRS